MPITIIIGGQYGSEGKGKVTKYFIEKQNAYACIKVGGSNSGHSIIHNNLKIVLRNLPVSAVSNNCLSILPPGSYLNIDLLFKEIELTKISSNNLLIDPNCIIITDKDIKCEQKYSLNKKIGSTESGVGASLIKRIRRNSSTCLAAHNKKLNKFISPTLKIMRSLLEDNKRLIIEGTQGYGLSLLHSIEYPYVTARDTSAAGFLSETGLSPFDVNEIVLVLRSYPIRVAGNSGYLKNEIEWDDIGLNIKEYTSVTKRLRRVGLFDAEAVIKAIECNNPSKIVLNHLDYVKEKFSFIQKIEKEIKRNIDYVGLDDKTILAKNEWFGG